MTPQTFINIGMLAVIMEAASGIGIGEALTIDFDLYPTPPTPAPPVFYNPRRRYFHPDPDYGGYIDYLLVPGIYSPRDTYGNFPEPFQHAPQPLPRYQTDAPCEFHSSLIAKVMNANRSPKEEPQSFYVTKRILPLPLNHRHDASCPNLNWFLWERQGLSSMPLCPAETHGIDLGENFFPRYIYNKVCRCKKCVVKNRAHLCNGLSRVVTAFQRVGCKNGWAVTKPKTFEVQTSCFCQALGPGI